MKWQATTVNPKDANWIQGREFQVIEVCRMYSMPPHKIGDYSQAHLANVEESNLDYLMTTLMSQAEGVEQEYNLKLLTYNEWLDGYYYEHLLAAILRGNMKDRAAYYAAMQAIGLFTPNIIAHLENMNPIGPDGDIHLVSANLQPLKNADKPKPAATSPGLPKPAELDPAAAEPDADDPDKEKKATDGNARTAVLSNGFASH
jgi:phage portal protein BeeE